MHVIVRPPDRISLSKRRIFRSCKTTMVTHLTAPRDTTRSALPWRKERRPLLGRVQTPCCSVRCPWRAPRAEDSQETTPWTRASSLTSWRNTRLCAPASSRSASGISTCPSLSPRRKMPSTAGSGGGATLTLRRPTTQATPSSCRRFIQARRRPRFTGA